MSNIEVTEPYVYQPFGIQNKAHWAAKRVYAIAGWNPLTRIEGLTKAEADIVLAVLCAHFTNKEEPHV